MREPGGWGALAVGTVALLLTVAALAAGHINFVFIPSIGGDHVIATLSMPLGTPAGHDL